jgi:hypothetical protein
VSTRHTASASQRLQEAVDVARKAVHQALKDRVPHEQLSPLVDAYMDAVDKRHIAEHGRAAFFRGAYKGASTERAPQSDEQRGTEA